jgi:hypothetical protein
MIECLSQTWAATWRPAARFAREPSEYLVSDKNVDVQSFALDTWKTPSAPPYGEQPGLSTVAYFTARSGMPGDAIYCTAPPTGRTTASRSSSVRSPASPSFGDHGPDGPVDRSQVAARPRSSPRHRGQSRVGFCMQRHSVERLPSQGSWGRSKMGQRHPKDKGDTRSDVPGTRRGTFD